MLLVNLRQSWPEVEAGSRTVEDVTLGDWAQLTDDALETYADVVLGIYKHEVVSAFDIESWIRDPETGRIRFTATESQEWAPLVGGPNPGPRWEQGQATPVKRVDTDTVRGSL